MKSVNSILIHPSSKDQGEIFEKIAKALKVPYELKEDSPYKEEFVEMLREAEIEFQAGKGVRINLNDMCK